MDCMEAWMGLLEGCTLAAMTRASIVKQREEEEEEKEAATDTAEGVCVCEKVSDHSLGRVKSGSKAA